MAKPAISIPDDLLARIDGALKPGESRSAWLCAAAETVLDAPPPKPKAPPLARGKRRSGKDEVEPNWKAGKK